MNMMKSYLSSILCFTMIPLGMNCKPRRGSSLSETQTAEALVKQQAVDIAYFHLTRAQARNNPSMFWMEKKKHVPENTENPNNPVDRALTKISNEANNPAKDNKPVDAIDAIVPFDVGHLHRIEEVIERGARAVLLPNVPSSLRSS